MDIFFQSLDALNIILGIVAVIGTGGAALGAKQGLFFIKALKQAVSTFEEVREANSKIYDRVKVDPERKELTKVLEGTIRKVEGLSKIIKDKEKEQ